MKQTIQIQLGGRLEEARQGENLLKVLRRANHAPDAPCGGNGKCGKCLVEIEDSKGRRTVLACQTEVWEDMKVHLPKDGEKGTRILLEGHEAPLVMDPLAKGKLLAFDIGTTTVVCYLLSPEDGKELSHASMLNPQEPFGADVISRIQCAVKGEREALTKAIREGMESLIKEVCERAGVSPSEIGVVSVVGNPCMQQLFLGMEVNNLAAVPFAPVLKESAHLPAADYLPSLTNALLLVVPDIAGYVGADTLGCVLSSQMEAASGNVLMVDIGTNGEMVLKVKDRMAACSTAAGPALEGARIRFGMRGANGAIDHVSLTEKDLNVHVIGEGKAIGICGSGLIDAVAAMKRAGILNRRGRIQTGKNLPDFAGRIGEKDGERIFALTEDVYLTQQDIREVQMAKGAIAAGIELMAEELGIQTEEIDQVLLAGAFGSFLNADSACDIGLLPACLCGRISVIGNAAGSGAKMLACDQKELAYTDRLLERIEFLELASLPGFQRCFAKNMNL